MFVHVCFVRCSGRVVGLDAPCGNMAVRGDGFFQGWVRREKRYDLERVMWCCDLIEV